MLMYCLPPPQDTSIRDWDAIQRGQDAHDSLHDTPRGGGTVEVDQDARVGVALAVCSVDPFPFICSDRP